MIFFVFFPVAVQLGHFMSRPAFTLSDSTGRYETTWACPGGVGEGVRVTPAEELDQRPEPRHALEDLPLEDRGGAEGEEAHPGADLQAPPFGRCR